MDDDDPFTYSTIEIPSVVGLLKNVLTQYPDNGQILKELVQNAEDAGATSFEVVHDTRTRRTGKKAQRTGNKDIRRFIQGPALLAYNNAVFTSEDWHGIRMLSDSIKRKDLLKVGQFGLGFKSVFHFTDVVTIISGKNVLFMDPTEPETKMCRELPIAELLHVIPEKDCLELWGMYLQKEHLNTGHFPGTIFWFPLRRKESKLSTTIYKQKNVERLFESFKVEAPLCLTFLKSLESLSITRTSEKQPRNYILKVNLNNATLSEVQQKRQAFRNKLQECKGFPNEPLTCKYDIGVDTYDEHGSVSEQKFKILQYLPCTPEDMRTPHMPLVGVAAPIPQTSRDASGKLYCFLPLPLESANDTNLPIQINGYFVLDQNRRHVKWETEECSSEPDVVWNEALVKNVVADAYSVLLEDMLKDACSGTLHIDAWYNLLPNIVSSSTETTTNGRWRELSHSVWKKLVQKTIIYSDVKGEMMFPVDVVSTANLHSLPKQVAKSVRTALEDVGVPLATIPEHIEETLRSMGAEPKPVTPKLLRDCLRSYSVKDSWNRLHLLEYVVSDSQYADLEGIQLLPLENGSWIKFSRCGTAVYICSDEEAAAFVGAEEQLLKTSLPTKVSAHLHKLTEGMTTLRRFLPKVHTTELLPISVQYIQKSSPSHKQLEKWLEKVWSLLHHVNLQKIENLPLIPTTEKLTVSSLVSLSSAIIVKDLNCQVPEAFIESLRLLNIEVLSFLADYVRHPELHNCLCKLDGQGVNHALEKVLSKRHNTDDIVATFNLRRTDEQRLAFCKFMNEIHVIRPPVNNLLKRLCLFKAVDRDNDEYVSVENVKNMYPAVKDFPVSSPELLIMPCNSNLRSLALKLEAIQISKEDLCISALKNNYSEEDAKKLGWYILSDHVLCKTEKICSHLKNVKFITSSSGRLCRPSQLYDPLDNDIDALLGEDLTPDKKFSDYRNILKCLGLKSLQDMPKDELVKIMREVSTKQQSASGCAVKINALLRVIENRSDCKQICQELRNVKCVYGVSSKPDLYPSNLCWATGECLYEPYKVKGFHSFKEVVGSVVPLVDCKGIPNVASSFEWNQEPLVDEIIQHLKNLIEVCPEIDKVPESSYYEDLKKIYLMLKKFVGSPKERLLFPLTELAFIFTRNGFKLPREVYLPSGKENLQLLPYMQDLPFELYKSKELFCVLGAFKTQSLQLYLEVLQQIQKHHSSSNTFETEHDMRLVISILEKLVEFSGKIDRKQLLLPVETSQEGLELVEIAYCTYSDQDCDWLDGEELGVKVVHKSVGNRLAKALGVESLSKHLLADEEAVMEWEQHEPLTTRINNLLRQYRDGVAVLKELIQNADDAGATQISFLYDERQNLESCQRLITDQLKECQGPALWAYNNATFSEIDFQNLCKLGGGTKELMTTKIGKFGLGFCSVYNLTDVPSVVSGNNYVIFDPHKKYLGGKKGGVRYDFSKKMNKIMLKKLDGQFQPFCDIFECQIQETSCYDGTLFRFPLRTTAQANESKICRRSYSHSEMIELLTMFREIVGEVLLFTQNIKVVKVWNIAKDSLPQDMELLYEGCREEQKSVRGKGSLDNQRNAGVNQIENVAQLFDSDHKWNGKISKDITINDIRITSSGKCGQLIGREEEDYSLSTMWITSWHSGTERSCRLAEKLGRKVLSLASVSVPVERISDYWKPKKLENIPLGFYKESHMHCFLPLPVKTPLPVQVNGYFEIAADRTSLMTRTEDDRSIQEDWNLVLMGDAVCSAYVNLISTLKVEGLCQEASYFSLWPVVNQASDELLLHLTKSFYDKIKNEDLEVFRNKFGWYPLSKCCFLSDIFYCVHEVGPLAFEFMGELLNDSDRQIMELPQEMLANFGDEVSDSIIGEESFYCEYLLPNLSQNYIDQEKRNKLILHVIDSQKPFLNKLKDIACIPTLPHGKLRNPIDLIDPKSELANLFSIADERFPVYSFLEGNRRAILLILGMKSEKLDVEMVSDRAQSVSEIACLSCAVIRSTRILGYIDRNRTQAEEIARNIKRIAFIPVKPKPEGWPATWEGEKSEGEKCLLKRSTPCNDHRNTSIDLLALAAPNSVCSPELIGIAGSTHFIHGYIDHDKYDAYQMEVCKTLGIITHQNNLPFHSVVKQLAEYRVNSVTMESRELKKVCFEIYAYLNYQAEHNLLDLSELRNEKILITDYGFIEPKLFAIDVDIDCAPALFSVQRQGLCNFEHMMKSLGVSQHFPPTIVYAILMKKKNDFQSKILPEEEVILVSKLVSLLFRIREEAGNEGLLLADLCLPNSKCILWPIGDLCVDDGAQIERRQFNLLHEKVLSSQEMLRWLGIKVKSKKFFQDSSHRMKFGQKEALTTRLRSILENYPCDSGIMKELLQNADDAGATEIAFINDMRNHPTEKLFDKMWEPLQGPALCVYNNRGFTIKDLEGIQNLGNSSKIHDPASTGQYGIGFNAVYHLTDAPSFMTRGKEIPGNETLCLFDPHCMYDPEATHDSPGTQLDNLHSLRELYPDSFRGYPEDLLKEEGTLFRLPLRTYEESKIGKVISKWDLEKLLEEFKTDMKSCLLFLRNVRKISICTIKNDGKLSVDYSVESHIEDEGKLTELKKCFIDRKNKIDGHGLLFFLDMQRFSYELVIKDSHNEKYRWLVAHQIGSENSSALSEIILSAYNEKSLKLLPQAGVAVLLEATKSVDATIFRSFCYLPLHVRSGFAFCINGHFVLDNARRNLWVGSVHSLDYKAAWNNWLMEQVLVPLIAEAINSYKSTKFKDEEISLEEYEKNIKLYYDVFPSCEAATSDRWKNVVNWFYQFVKNHEIPLFDVYIPCEDEMQRKGFLGTLTLFIKVEGNQVASNSPSGKLKWHALKERDAKFPVYFDDPGVKGPILGTLKRLGMKLGNIRIYKKLEKAEIEVDLLNPENVVDFLLSTNMDCVDRCQPAILSEICGTPFLSVENVCMLFKYVSSVKGFHSKLNHMPLLVTSDNILKQFDEHHPVYLTEHGKLLPKFKHEFVHIQLFSVMKVLNISAVTTQALKHFTLDEFAMKLHSTLDQKYYSNETMLPLGGIDESFGKHWLKDVWNYIIEEGKQDLNALGNWALYPVTFKGAEYVVPVKRASLVLSVGSGCSAFNQLHVPHTLTRMRLDESLQLSTTLLDPVAVLEVLYHWREELAAMTGECNKFDFCTVLEYLGENCQRTVEEFYRNKRHERKICLSINKLKSLKMYEDRAGLVCSLDKYFIYPWVTSGVLLDYIYEIGTETNTIILKPKSDLIVNLYKYLDPGCIMCDLKVFPEYILPNFSILPQSKYFELLKILKRQLDHTENKRKPWTQEEISVVSILSRTPFILLNEKLETADKFYDPCNPVFVAMKVSNLPNKWTKHEWSYFLRLAGMVHELTSEMFVNFARSLSNEDSDVKLKSQVLVDCLSSNYARFESKMDEICNIEFLVPEKKNKLAGLYPYFETDSKLVSFSSSAPQIREELLWTTMSVIPSYAYWVAEYLEVNSNVPREKFFSHVCNITRIDPASDKCIEAVMDSIYKHLSTMSTLADQHFLHSFFEKRVPIIHLTEKGKFATADVVSQQLVDIEPYLYKAPLKYKNYFYVLEKLGLCSKSNCDPYVKVLTKIHDCCKGKTLNPEESRCVKLIMENLAENRKELSEITSLLYLPTKDKKLVSSTDMYVSDNKEFERATSKSLGKPLFIGFKALDINRSDADFVRKLPVNLKPKFLSEVIREVFDREVYEEIESPEAGKITNFIFSQAFQDGILRLLTHYRLQSGGCLEKEEETEVQMQVKSVKVKALKTISLSLMLNGKTEVGKRVKSYYVKADDDSRTIMLYINESTPSNLIHHALAEIYTSLFKEKFNSKASYMYRDISGIIQCLDEPQNIHEWLDELNIRDSGDTETTINLYEAQIGTPLPQEFVPLLHKETCSFHNGEIVVKRNPDGEPGFDEERGYIIVQVKCKVKSTNDMRCDEYKVIEGNRRGQVSVVQAQQLYKFMRKNLESRQYYVRKDVKRLKI